MEDPIEALEQISFGFDKMDKNNYYMIQQISDNRKARAIKINFNYCLISISKNGGLIAICKTKSFFDPAKSSRLNKNVIVMFQNSKTKYEVPIDWDYSKRWVVCLDFLVNQDLYGVLNDGGIFKFKYRENTKKEVPSSQTLKQENIIKAKFYENGFIAYTKFENFYYIKNIRDPTPIFMFSTGIINLSPNFDFLMISPENSSSGKLELLMTNEKGDGVYHTEQMLTGDNIQRKIIDENTSQLVGLNIILKGSPEPYIIKNFQDKNESNDKKDKKEDNFGKITCITQSPSGKKIAFYNSEKKEAYILKSDLMGEYSTVYFKYNDKEKSEMEKNELKAILEFKEGYQFLFCDEDTLALSGQRFIIISRPNAENALTYLIQEGGAMQAAQGTLFSRCISEIDGLRILTNDGVYFLSKVQQEFFDVCYPFSNSDTRKFIQIYNKHKFSLRYDTQLEIKKFENLPTIIEKLQSACSYIFWTDDDTESNKKELQLFIIKAAQFGKNFLTKGKEEFNYDKFNERCREIRMVNQLRNDQRYPLYVTYKEYIELNALDIIDIMLKYKNFKVASDISEYLGYKTDKVKYKYMIEQMKNLIKKVQKYRYSDEKSKEREMEEEQIYKEFLEEVEKIPDISYVNLAKKAIKFRNEKLSMKLLEQEKSALTKIPQLLELKKLSNSLDICFKTYDFNILSIVIQKLSNNISFTDIILDYLKKPEFQCHLPQILLYYKRYKPEELSKFLSESKNYNYYLYFKLEELFNEEDPTKKKNILTECIKCNKNGNLKYKKYLDILNSSLSLQEECIKNGFISNTGKNKTDGTVYDFYFKSIKKFEYTFVEKQNKNLEYSSKKLNLLKFRSLIEDKKLKDVDEILEKTPLKKLGLTPLNMAEIYYDYKIYDRAAEYLMQVKEANYLFYVVDLLKNMGENKKALEIVISNKDFEMKEMQINEIIKKDPTLKEYVDELCVKYKINL
jgi:hypothetical protein